MRGIRTRWCLALMAARLQSYIQIRPGSIFRAAGQCIALRMELSVFLMIPLTDDPKEFIEAGMLMLYKTNISIRQRKAKNSGSAKIYGRGKSLEAWRE